jgi:hypothetical protein
MVKLSANAGVVLLGSGDKCAMLTALLFYYVGLLMLVRVINLKFIYPLVNSKYGSRI